MAKQMASAQAQLPSGGVSGGEGRQGVGPEGPRAHEGVQGEDAVRSTGTGTGGPSGPRAPESAGEGGAQVTSAGSWVEAGLSLGDCNVQGWRRWVESRLVAQGWWGMGLVWKAALGIGSGLVEGVTLAGDMVNGRYRVYRVGRRGAIGSAA